MEAAVQVQSRADDGARGQCHDEQHGVLAAMQIGDGGVQTDGQRSQSQGIVEPHFVFLFDSAVQQRPNDGACHDGCCVDDGSYHVCPVLWVQN